MLSNGALLTYAKKFLYEGVIVPTALFGAESQCIRSSERNNVNVLEMKCLTSLWECRDCIELGMTRCVEELE